MRARRLEEVLEECLSAYVEGRRSIAESLSLYPALAHELEPLLRTAARLADTYGAAAPPPHVVERVRERFMFAAATRKRARALAGGIGSGRLALPRWLPQMSMLGAAAALGVIVIAAAVLTNGSSGGDETVFNTTAPAPRNTASVVADLRNLHTHVKEVVSQGKPLDADTIQQLSDVTNQIASDPTLTQDPTVELQQVIADQVLLLTTVAAPPTDQPPTDHYDDLVRDTLSVANQLNVPVAPFSPVPTASPAPTQTPVATTTATPSATPSATPAATATPEPTTATPGSTVAPTPAPTDDIRQPQIGP